MRNSPRRSSHELAAIYQSKGLSPETAGTVAGELTAHDALGAHLSAELNIDETDIVSPWHAAFASAIAFLIGAILPMLAILLPPENIRIPLTFVAVLVALAATGALGAWIGGGSKLGSRPRGGGRRAGPGGDVRDRQPARRQRHRLKAPRSQRNHPTSCQRGGYASGATIGPVSPSRRPHPARSLPPATPHAGRTGLACFTSRT